MTFKYIPKSEQQLSKNEQTKFLLQKSPAVEDLDDLEALVVGWKNLVDKDGVVVPFSRPALEQLPPAVRQEIATCAQDAAMQLWASMSWHQKLRWRIRLWIRSIVRRLKR